MTPEFEAKIKKLKGSISAFIKKLEPVASN
jgi:hypothetical protein